MSNIIKIKRGAGKPANGVLKAGELGFDTTNKDLYIGTGDTDSSAAEKIGLGSDIVPIERGGTNASTATNARTNLGFTYGTTVPTETPATGEGSVYFKIDDDETSKYPTLDMIYPVGSLYWSMNSTDPSTLFGGTWERIKDKFILAAGDSYTSGNTGGAATVALTTAQLPAHNHTASVSVDSSSHGHSASGSTGNAGYHTHNVGADLDAVYAGSGTRSYSVHSRGTSGAGALIATGDVSTLHSHSVSVSVSSSSHSHTASASIGNTGDGSAHNNMPPYLVAYCWQRIS